MPRTKQPKLKSQSIFTYDIMTCIEAMYENERKGFNELFNETIVKTEKIYQSFINKIPESILKTTIEELKKSELNGTEQLESLSDTEINTRNTNSTTKKRRSRSFTSIGDAELGSDRSKLKPQRKTVKNIPPPSASKYTTPMNRNYPQKFGLITPKVKNDTPLSIVRQPNPGEMAFSVNGSPIMSVPTQTDFCANINIPLGNKILSIQPNRGIRASILPELHEFEKKQLLLLRENLQKICERAENN